MFSNITVGILMGIGIAGWVYAKVQRRTGGNTQNSLIVAGLVGFLAFLATITALSIFFN